MSLLAIRISAAIGLAKGARWERVALWIIAVLGIGSGGGILLSLWIASYEHTLASYAWLAAGVAFPVALSFGAWRLYRLRLDRLVRQVLADIDDYLHELTEFCEQAEGDGDEERLKLWKTRVMSYLDAHLGPDVVKEFNECRTSCASGQTREHLKNSCNEHRDYLARLCSEVELHQARLRDPPTPSGVKVPWVRSFIYRL